MHRYIEFVGGKDCDIIGDIVRCIFFANEGFGPRFLSMFFLAAPKGCVAFFLPVSKRSCMLAYASIHT